LASLLARLRGRAICGVTVSMAGTALLTVSQYLAASTADKPDLPARTDPGHPPPFRSADGVSFELETFSAQPWRLLWTSLGVPDTVADRAWQPFMLRYVSAVAPLPAALHLVAINPRLVSAHASGWGDALGADPPPGTDFMVQAYAGLPDHLTPADEAPAGSLMTLLDVLGGLIATSGVLAGLLGRERDGRGAGCQLPAVRRRPAASPAKRTGTTRTARVQDVRSTAARGGRRPRAQPKRLAARSHRRTRSMPGDDRFLVPLYSAVEAARHLDVPASTFRTWAHGYRNRPRGRPPVVGESIVTTVPADSGASIPFVGLAATPPRRGALGNSSSCATTNESSPR
ncbi:MAG: CoA transferase, partial [Mycobacteriales bacterium]